LRSVVVWLIRDFLRVILRSGPYIAALGNSLRTPRNNVRARSMVKIGSHFRIESMADALRAAHLSEHRWHPQCLRLLGTVILASIHAVPALSRIPTESKLILAGSCNVLNGAERLNDLNSLNEASSHR
jgi:hypothetical protein